MDFKAPGSFEIYWKREYLVNFTGLTGIVNTTVYKTETIFAGLGQIVLILYTEYLYMYIDNGELIWYIDI